MAAAAPKRNYSSKWLFCTPKPQAELRVFFFTHVGAGATYYMQFMKQLPDNVEGLAVWLPGRGARMKEPAMTSVPEISKAILDSEVGGLMCEKPCVFFGHSYGAGLAYRVAVDLQAANRPLPRRLLLSSRPSPDYVYPDPIWKRTDAQIVDHLRKMGGTPEEVLSDKSMMDMTLPILKADWQASETLRADPADPQSRLDIPFTVFWGTEDLPEVLEQVRGWERFSNSPADLTPLEGDHFYLQKEGGQVAIKAVIASCATPPAG